MAKVIQVTVLLSDGPVATEEMVEVDWSGDERPTVVTALVQEAAETALRLALRAHTEWKGPDG